MLWIKSWCIQLTAHALAGGRIVQRGSVIGAEREDLVALVVFIAFDVSQ